MFNVRKANVDAQFEVINQSYETLEVETLAHRAGGGEELVRVQGQ